MPGMPGGTGPRQQLVLLVPMGINGGSLWDDAAADGRIRPGRGPYFTRRVLPVRLPVARAGLVAAGVRRSVLARDYATLTRGVLILLACDADDGTASLPDTGGEPGRYRYDIITRSRAFEVTRPGGVRGYWAAAAHLGLVYWADSSAVVIHRGRNKRGSLTDDGPVSYPVFRPLPTGAGTVTPDPAFPDLQVVDAATCAVQCLTTVLTGKKTWWVPVVPGLASVTVRAVQFLDAFFQCTWLTPQDVAVAARNHIDRRQVADILALTDPGFGAQSPMETALRLIVREELPARHLWTSQVHVSLTDGSVQAGGSAVRCAVPDLACPELKVALFYDGGHHDAAAQVDTDFDMVQSLRDVGWEVVRVNKTLLKKRSVMLKQLRAAIARGLAGAG